MPSGIACLSLFNIAMAIAVKPHDRVAATMLFAAGVTLGIVAYVNNNNTAINRKVSDDDGDADVDPRLADPTILPTLFRTPVSGA
jgi:hypothetical protein